MTQNSEGKPIISDTVDCDVTPVGKRRDGGTRYWCLTHKADATAKYGRPALHCRAAHIAPVSAAETMLLNIDEYPGGVALWGAVPPIYDTTRLPLERGIHVHARKTRNGVKDVDRTVRAVRLTGGGISPSLFLLSELEAIYYMVSKIICFEMRHVLCPYCGYSHLDKDWFSVHVHQRHLCDGCGKSFRDSIPGIGNPIRRVQRYFSNECGNPRKSSRYLNLAQRDFPGGIQIWGSNPAFVWTLEDAEEEGIHVHAFEVNGETRSLDDTYSEVVIDGICLDPVMVRTLMAQSALPHIENRIVSLTCIRCLKSEFSVGDDAFTPKAGRTCSMCGEKLKGAGRLRKAIANPIVGVLDGLGRDAPRTPQKHSSGLLIEAPSKWV